MTNAARAASLTLQMNTKLVTNCFDGVDAAAALHRIDGQTNNMAFLLLHLLDARHFLLRYLGCESQSPFAAVGEHATRLDDIAQLPGVAPMLEAFAAVSTTLADHLQTLTAADLAREATARFPIDDATLLGGLAFLVAHESYHLGQLGLLRRALGLGSMRYR